MSSHRRTLLLLASLVAFAHAGQSPSPVVPAVKARVQPEIDRHLAAEQPKVMKELALGKRYPAMLKTPVRTKAAADPWGGMADLERHGLEAAAAAAKGLANLAAVLDALSASIGKPPGDTAAIPRKGLASLDDHASYVERVLGQARTLRDGAIAKLTADNRKFMVAWPAAMLKHFGPQIALNPQTRPLCTNDRAFCAFAAIHYQWPKFVGTANTLALLADARYLALLTKALQSATPIAQKVQGVSGDILFTKETPHGLILFGGKGANRYDLTVPVAVLVDLGGDDAYTGTVAASFDADHPNSLVIDLAGDDVYRGKAFGLATGRLGVGMLVDLAGDDTYRLALGTGGAGFGGIGILCDAQGRDTYTGSKWTQGVAIGGIGLLLDLAGDDTHTSHGYAIGLGGPGGAGAVIDVAGNDSYQCGHKIPSGYNRADAPNAKPGDPRFQFMALGMGMGLGRRILARKPQDQAYSLAGGVGMVIDVAGKDRYDSSNFSQGCGYFFGVGLKLDLAGDDVHGAARYGHASGAHFGMGLFIDYDGNDTYKSAGPTYNGGCAWDHSAFLFIEAGNTDDAYEWERSAGPARADIGSWSVFAEMGGSDRYATRTGLARTSRNSLAVFYDGAGKDDYTGVKGSGKTEPANGKTLPYGTGGLFIDR